MSGMLQHGSTTLIQLPNLLFQGTVAGGDSSTTFTIAHPLIKAGDVPLLNFPQLPEGLAVGVYLQEWYCVDGALKLTYRGTEAAPFAMNQLIGVALLRSPGFVRGPQPVPDMGPPIRGGDVANAGAPGPKYPLWIDWCTNDAEVTIAAGESKTIACSFWLNGPPPSQTPFWNTLPCQFRGPLGLVDGLVITGWQTVVTVAGPGSIFRLGVINRTGAPIVVPIGGIGEVALLVAGEQAYTTDTRAYAAGGRVTGTVTRRHTRGATFPAANQDVVAVRDIACDISNVPTTPDGQRQPAPVPPADSRIWATAPRGFSGSGLGFGRLNMQGTGGRCVHRSYVIAATTVNANTLTQDMQHVDFIV